MTCKDCAGVRFLSPTIDCPSSGENEIHLTVNEKGTGIEVQIVMGLNHFIHVIEEKKVRRWR